MSAEAQALCGAGYGEVSTERTNSRNGYRSRDWDTRAGSIELRVPKLRQGSYFPEWLLGRRRRSEQALISVIATSYLLGVSTRRVERLCCAMGIDAISKSQVSEMAKALDEAVEVFRNRPLDQGPYRFLWADALVCRVREEGAIRKLHVLIATGVNASGYREILQTEICSEESGAGLISFFRSLVAQGLSGVCLVSSDAHRGLVEAIGATLPGASPQRCRTRCPCSGRGRYARSRSHRPGASPRRPATEAPAHDRAPALRAGGGVGDPATGRRAGAGAHLRVRSAPSRPCAPLSDPGCQKRVGEPVARAGTALGGYLAAVLQHADGPSHRTAARASVAAPGGIQRVGILGDRREHAPLACGQRAPDRTQLVADLMHRVLIGRLPGLVGGGMVGRCVLEESVGQEHRALRMAGAQLEQRIERLADVASVLLEAACNVLRDVFGGERRQLHRRGLSIEGPAAVGEELAHHADVRAGEYVACGVAVVLNLRADHGVETVLGGQHVLELVEDDERARAASLVQAARQGKAVKERRLGLRVEGHLEARRHRTAAGAEGGAQHPPRPGKPGGKAALELLGVCALDALGDVGEREHAEEVDVDRGPAGAIGIADHAPQQRCLPEPPRRHQTAVVALLGARHQRLRLGVAVDQLLDGDGLAVAEGIDAREYRAILLACSEQTACPANRAACRHPPRLPAGRSTMTSTSASRVASQGRW